MEVQTWPTTFPRGGLPVGVVSMSVGRGEVGEHAHDFLVVELVVGGAGSHVTASGSHPVARGSVLVVRPGVRHSYDVPRSLDLVNLCIPTVLLHEELSWVLDLPRLALALLGAEESRGVLTEDALARILGLVDRVVAWLPTRPPPVLHGLTSAILSELADVEFSPATAIRSSPISELVRDAMLLMVRDVSSEWTVAELAGRLRTSPSSLYRSFRAQTGASPLAWLTQFRAEQAAVLLTRTDLPIASIGRRVGWSDPNYFSRRFREIFGTPPSGHRRRFRIGPP